MDNFTSGHATTGAMRSISLPSGSKSVRTEEARRKATTGSASSSPSSASASSSHAAASGSVGTYAVLPDVDGGADRVSPAGDRSEEHTSELQSRLDLVCRLLLEK